jgi:hypothetical protein
MRYTNKGAQYLEKCRFSVRLGFHVIKPYSFHQSIHGLNATTGAVKDISVLLLSLKMNIIKIKNETVWI